MKHFLANAFAIILIIQMLSIFFSKENFAIRYFRSIILFILTIEVSDLLNEEKTEFLKNTYQLYYQISNIYICLVMIVSLVLIGFAVNAGIKEINGIRYEEMKLPGFMKELVDWLNCRK